MPDPDPALYDAFDRITDECAGSCAYEPCICGDLFKARDAMFPAGKPKEDEHA